jgi:hypothetical protein
MNLFEDDYTILRTVGADKFEMEMEEELMRRQNTNVSVLIELLYLKRSCFLEAYAQLK